MIVCETGKYEEGESFTEMVSQGRFERPTFPLGGGCSIQLSYWDKCHAYPEGLATDGVHLNGRGWFCHVVRWHFDCRPIPAHAFKASSNTPRLFTAIVQIALRQYAIIANCNPATPKVEPNSLFLLA